MKHDKISQDIKDKYILRYKNGESAINLGFEIKEKFNITSKKPSKLIYNWIHKKENPNTNKMRRGRKPHAEIKSEVLETIEKNNICELFNTSSHSDIVKFLLLMRTKTTKNKREVFAIIENIGYLPKEDLCKYFGVSRSGFYKWRKTKPTNKYNTLLSQIIIETFHNRNSVYGYKRLAIQIEREHGVKINKNTTYRYMKHLGLKSEIRGKNNQRMKEDKNTEFFTEDLIKRDWKSNFPYQKLFTDVTWIRIRGRSVELSVILDTFNYEILEWKLSETGGVSIILPLIENLVDREIYNFIIHSDHGSEYASIALQKFVKKYNIKWSMGRVGNSLDNRAIEYFFGILKTKYLNNYFGIVDFIEMEKIINVSMNDYNKKRISGHMGNKTPFEIKLNYFYDEK